MANIPFLNNAYFSSKVGIGTDSPGGELEVNGTIRVGNSSGGVFIRESGLKGEILGLNNTGTSYVDLSIRSASGTQLYLDTNGNVGIGTTSPLDLLALHNNTAGTVDAQMNFTTAATGQGGADGFRVGWNGELANIYLFEDADMRFATNNAERMRITSTGAIKLNSYNLTNNTGTPTYLLGTDSSGNIVKTNTIPGSAAGPYLPLDGGTMIGVTTFADHTVHLDQVKAKFGTGGDLEIYHTGTHSFLKNTTGNLYIQDDGYIEIGNSTELYGSFTANGAVKLFYDNVQKFETTSTGVTVTGKVVIADGTTAPQSTDYLYIGGAGLSSADAAIYIGNEGAGGGYGYRIYYAGIGSGNNNTLILKSENLGSPVDMLTFNQLGAASFASTIDAGAITSTGTITADSRFVSSDTAAILSTTGAGTVYLRPVGQTSATGQVTIANTGEVNVSGQIRNVTAGTTNLDAVNLQQLNNATTGVLTYKGVWAAGTTGVTSAATTTTAVALTAAPTETIAVGDIVTGEGISGLAITVATVTSQTALVLSAAVTVASGVTVTFSPAGGFPDLTATAKEVEGDYYITNVAGYATPNDASTTPNEWAVGDWCIFTDADGTNQWQKLDNSSTLDGAGSGGSLAAWSGTGTSVTLQDAPITYSGNDITAVGKVGISTPSVSAYELSVLGTTRFDGNSLSDPDATSTANYPAAHTFTHTSVDNGVAIYGGAGGFTGTTLMIGQETSQNNDYDQFKVIADTNGTPITQFLVKGSGNVSIGNTNNTYKLDVSGTGRFTGALTGTSASFNSGATNVVATFTSTDGIAGIALVDSGGNIELSASGDTFQVQPAGGVAKLTVDSSKTSLAGMLNIVGSRSTYVDNAEDDTATSHIFTTDALVGDFAQLAGSLVLQARVNDAIYRDIIMAGGLGTVADPVVPIVTVRGEGIVQFNTYGGTTNTGTPTYLLGTDASGDIVKTLATSGSAGNWTKTGNNIYNNNSGNVGIGISNPTTAKLHVNGNQIVSTTLSVGTTNVSTTAKIQAFSSVVGGNAIYGLNYDGSGKGLQGQTYRTTGTGTSYGVRGIGSNAGTQAGINIGGYFEAAGAGTSNYALITGAGDVGIGTGSPVTKLHIHEEAAAPVLLTLHNSYGDITSNGTQGNFIDFKMTDGNATFTPQARIGMLVKDSDGDIGIPSEGCGNLVFYTGKGTDTVGGGTLTEKLRITDEGNVGIGIDTPTEKLEVVGNIILDSSSARLKIKGGVAGTNSGIDWTFNSDSTQYAKIELDYDTRASIGLLIDSGYPMTLDWSAGDFTVSKNGSTKLVIDDGGNVGIGTTNPITTLQVGSITTTVLSQVTGKVQIVGLNYDISGTQMGTLNVTSTSRNVGGSNQGLGSSISFSQNASKYVDGYETVIGGIKSELMYVGNMNKSSTMRFFTHNNTDLVEQMRIVEDGNVGIGNINPSDYSADANNLVVGSLSGNNGITILSASTSGYGSIYFADASTGNKVYSGFIRYQQNISDMTFGTNEVERMRLTLEGYLGIGTTSPYVNLEVSDPVATNVPTIRVGGSAQNQGSKIEIAESLDAAGAMLYGYSLFNDGNGSNRLYIKNHNNSTAGANAIVIERTSGGIGLGGDYDASYKLKVHGATRILGDSRIDGSLELYGATKSIKLNNTAETAVGIEWTDTGDPTGQKASILWSSAGGNPMTFNVTSATRMTINSSGQVIVALTGSAAIPSLTVGGDTDSGFYNGGANIIGVTTGGTMAATFAANGTFTAAGDVIAYSDARLKKNIKTLDGSKVYDMRGVSFIKDDKESSGVIAQELEKIAPELVNSDGEYKAVAYGNITGYLIEAIKELKAEVDELKSRL